MIIVGSEECSIPKLVSTMRKCGSFHLLKEMWPDIARELEAPSDLVKKVRNDILLDKLQTSDAMAEVVDEWVARCGKDATLQVFNGSLEKHGLKAVKEEIEKVFPLASKSTLESFPKYCKIPAELQAFLDQPKSTEFVCILLSLDVEITCKKLEENLEDCSVNDFNNILDIMSSKSPGKKDLYYLSLQEVSHLNRILTLAIDKKKLGTARLVVVTSGVNKIGIMEMLEPKLTWENVVQLLADKMEWDDLTPVHQDRILSKLMNSLKMNHLAEEDMGCILKGQLLVDLINGKDLKLFRETIPQQLSYYVERTLQTRNFVSLEILNTSESNTILVFTGIKRYELGGLLKDKITDSSSNQLRNKKLTVKHVILDHPNHFQLISELTEQPVHWLSYENKRFRWIQSSCGMAEIQQHVDNLQGPMTEAEFCQKIATNSTQPIIISDSPGMGKTIILAQLGSILLKQHPDKTVIFLVLSEFIRRVKWKKSETTTATILETLQELACGNELEKRFLKPELLSGKERSVELLLDAFDEISPSDIPLAFDVLKIMKTSLKSARLWVTSRPHFLEELEIHFGTLGYTLQPFNHENQISFLTSFWSSVNNDDSLILDKAKMKRYGKHCLETLKSSMNSKDHDIAGIPLQCLLIGEAYEKEAKTYATAEHSAISTILINSIADLYQRLIDKKIEKYVEVHMGSDWDRARPLMPMHAQLSVELIYPEHIDKLERVPGPLPTEELFKVGILERSSRKGAPRFIHRTFAEYFIATYVVSFDPPGLLEATLACQDSYSNEVGVDSFAFNQPVICYFINSLFADESVLKKYSTKDLKKRMQYSHAMLEIAHSCVNADLVQIFKLFHDQLKAFKKDEQSIFCEMFLLLAFEKSSFDLLQIILLITDRYQQLDSALKIKALRATVRKGDLSTVEYLINKMHMRGTLLKLNESTGLLLHDCVGDSQTNSVQIIQQKLEIIQILVKINENLLETSNDQGRTPLLANNANVELLKELIILGGNVLFKDSERQTLLHLRRGARMYSSQDYHSLLANIPEDKLRILVHSQGAHRRTPLASVLKELDPTTESLHKFKAAGADFNCTDGDGASLLQIAIRNGRNRETIRKLIECGAEYVAWRGAEGETFLHFAAQFGNVQAVEFLIDGQKMDSNLQDKAKLTPLDYAIKSDFKSETFIETGLALYKREGRFKEVVNSEGQSWLHFAAQQGNLQSVQLLLHIGTNVNAVDGHGNTPLHLLLSEWDSLLKTPILRLLLDSNANPNQQNNGGETPFYSAMKIDRLDMEAFLLLESTADWTPETASLALMIVVRNGTDLSDQQFDALTQELADNGANFNQVDAEGNSLLHIAVVREHERALHFLLSKKVEMDLANQSSWTPLHLAGRQRGNDRGIKAIKILIENGSNPYAVDVGNCTFLMHFLINCKSPALFDTLVEFLVDKKLCHLFNIPHGDNKKTPFQFAVFNFVIKKDTLMLLRSNSVDFDAVDKHGYSALGYAVDGNLSENVASLIACGANWKTLNTNKFSMLHLAALFGSLESLKLFLDLGGLDINGADVDGDTPLHCAVLQEEKEGVLDKCRLLINRGADVNIFNEAGRTPLEYALAERDDEDVYQELKTFLTDDVRIGPTETPLKTDNILENRISDLGNDNEDNCTIIRNFLSQSELPTPADFHDLCSSYFKRTNRPTAFNVANRDLGRNLFQEAVLKLEIEPQTLALFSAVGADFNAADKNGDSLLAYAVRGKRSTDFITALITDYGADPKSKNVKNENLLHISVVDGTSRTLELFLRFKQLDINGKDTAGYSPLHRLVEKADQMTESEFLDKYRLLVYHGADVNSVDNFNHTPLHSVSCFKKKNSLNIAKCLIEDGANVHAYDLNHKTFLPSYISTEPIPQPFELHSMAEYLIGKRHSDLFGAADRYEQTPLHRAVLLLEPEERTLVLLHSNGVNFNAVNKDGKNILVYAIEGKRSKEFLHTLVTRFGVDPTKLDKDENSLLHYLAREYFSDTLKFFLDLRLNSLDINGKNIFGNTPLHLLFLNPEIEILEKSRLLVSRGADVNSTNKWQYTPLHYITNVKDRDAMLKSLKFLLENGANPLAQNENKETFFHRFLVKKHSICSLSHFHFLVEYLLSRNCSEIFDIPEGTVAVTPLHLMVQFLEPEEKTMTLLHSRAVNFNAVDNDGDSVLHYAILRKRSINFLSNLVCRFETNPKHLNNNGESMLHTAAYEGTADALRLFLGYDLDINKTTKFGNTPLHFSVHPKNSKVDVLEKCRLLVGKGADVNIVNSNRRTPLSLVEKFYDGADKGEILLVVSNLEIGKTNQSPTACMGWTPEAANLVLKYIVEASEDRIDQKFLSRFKDIVDHGANINYVDEEGNSLFYIAAKKSKKNILTFLIENSPSELLCKYFNSPVGSRTTDKATLLQVVVEKVELEEKTLSYLHSAQVNFNAVDQDDDSILAYAISGGRSVKFISTLINKFGVNPNRRNNQNWSVLHWSAEEGSVDVLRYFLDLGVIDVNDIDKDGNTALHIAVEQEEGDSSLVEKCKLLIHYGSDVNILNQKGETAWDIAKNFCKEGSQAELLSLLIPSL